VADTAQENDESPTRTIAIHVVDEAGKPMKGVRIFRNHVYKPEGVERSKIESKSYRTDAAGKTVVALSGTSVDLRLWARKQNFVPLHAMWAQKFQTDGDHIPQEFTFRLERGTKIGGIVRNEKGEPIEGVKVEVIDETAKRFAATPIGRPGQRPVRSYWFDAIFTDAQGRWTLGNIPPEESPVFTKAAEDSRHPLQKITLRLSHPDYVDDSESGTRVTLNDCCVFVRHRRGPCFYEFQVTDSAPVNNTGGATGTRRVFTTRNCVIGDFEAAEHVRTVARYSLPFTGETRSF
jgi:hypothetical protein